MKPAVLRPAAKQDLSDDAIFYTVQGGERLGRKFLDAAVAALQPIERMPGLGSPRIGQLCNMPGLRLWSVGGWPVQWLYFERADRLDVVRLLGERQDIAAILAVEPPSPPI